MEMKQREVQNKLMRGLLDMVILQYLKSHPMHGYQIISSIRKNFGVYFGPSTIYPLLSLLEERGYVESQWDLSNERPRKVYRLTSEGEGLLSCTEDSLNIICRKLVSIGMGRLSLNDIFGKHASVTVKAPNGR